MENDTVPARYATYGCCVAEAEVDVLTGETQINRADIVMDVGERYWMPLQWSLS